MCYVWREHTDQSTRSPVLQVYILLSKVCIRSCVVDVDVDVNLLLCAQGQHCLMMFVKVERKDL